MPKDPSESIKSEDLPTAVVAASAHTLVDVGPHMADHRNTHLYAHRCRFLGAASLGLTYFSGASAGLSALCAAGGSKLLGMPDRARAATAGAIGGAVLSVPFSLLLLILAMCKSRRDCHPSMRDDMAMVPSVGVLCLVLIAIFSAPLGNEILTVTQGPDPETSSVELLGASGLMGVTSTVVMGVAAIAHAYCNR